MSHQTKLRTHEIIPNENICFPIGTILAVKNKYEKLDFSGVFDKHKKKGRDINSLIQALLSYKLTENLSVSKASEWINRSQVLAIFNLETFEERTLFRTLEIIGNNREEIIAEIDSTIDMIEPILDKLEEADINKPFPSDIHGKGQTIGSVLTKIALHLGYHLGQINYQRRILK